MAEAPEKLVFRTFDWKKDPDAVARTWAKQDEAAHIALPNPQDASKALENCTKVLLNVSKALAEVDLDGDFCKTCRRKGPTAESLAKTLSYVAKTTDETFRMLEFAKGGADSRAEVVGLSDLLKVLSQDQFDQLQGWIAMGLSRTSGNGPSPRQGS